jgi:hypothetical protein
MLKRFAVLAVAVLLASIASACGESKSPERKAYEQVGRKATKRSPYIPKNDVEFEIYNRAQRVWDSPDTIIWCTTTWGNPSAPIVTVPVAGKLMSSSTTFFQPNYVDHDSNGGNTVLPSRSVDGLFHPDPPKYRVGFTPAGQYIDFSEMPTFCTTALTKFQRQKTAVALTVDQAAQAAQRAAEKELKNGDPAAAQRILEEAIR